MSDVLLMLTAATGIVVVLLLLFFARLMPVFAILGVLLILRVIFDGVFKFPVLGTTVTSLLGGLILVLAIGVVLTGLRGIIAFFLIAILLYMSNFQGQAGFGPEIADEFYRFASILGLFFVVRNLRARPSSSSVLVLIQGLGLASAVFSIVQFVTGTGMLVEGLVRVAGTMAHPNSAALLYAICLSISVVGALSGRRRRLNFCLSVLFAIAMVVTGSMGGVIAALTMLATYGISAYQLPKRVRTMTAMVLIVTAVSFVLSPVGSSRLGELSGVQLSVGSETNSLEWRIGRWTEILTYWRDSPIIGQGFGSSTTGAMLNGYPPHNEYVRILVELGLVGACGAAVFVVLVIRRIRAAARDDSETSRLAGVSMAVTCGMLMNALSENTFMYSVPAYVLALLLGLVWRSGKDQSGGLSMVVSAVAVSPPARLMESDRQRLFLQNRRHPNRFNYGDASVTEGASSGGRIGRRGVDASSHSAPHCGAAELGGP